MANIKLITAAVVLLVTLSIISSYNSCIELSIPCGQQHTMDDVYRISYQFPDTIIYISNSDKIQKFYISYLAKGVITFSQNGKSMSGCYAYYDYEDIGICELGSVCDSSTYTYYFSISCPYCMTIYKMMDVRPIRARDKKFRGVELSWKNQWSGNTENNNGFYNSIKINNTVYSDVYYFTNKDIAPDSVINIYYNHKLGFVGFEIKDKILWNLKIN